MKIAILGASGFIGQYITRNLARDHEVYAFGRRESPFPQDISYSAWDIRFPGPSDYIFDVCIHLAADTDYEKPQNELIQNNSYSLQNIMDFLSTSQCKHFIYLSSSSVYMGKSGIISEDAPIYSEDITNSYALSKYLAEREVSKKLSSSMKISILRPRAVYGIGDTTLLPKILRHQFFSRLVLPGSGETRTSTLSLENLSQAISIVLNHQKTDFDIYNIADKELFSYYEIYTLISEKYSLGGILTIPLPIISALSFLLPNKWNYLYDTFFREKILNISKIEKLGYHPTGDIRSFLTKYEIVP